MKFVREFDKIEAKYRDWIKEIKLINDKNDQQTVVKIDENDSKILIFNFAHMNAHSTQVYRNILKGCLHGYLLNNSAYFSKTTYQQAVDRDNNNGSNSNSGVSQLALDDFDANDLAESVAVYYYMKNNVFDRGLAEKVGRKNPNRHRVFIDSYV